MSDDINKKITIDVEINTDSQKQITQYKAAFDNLQNSINGIKNPLNSISGDFKTLNKNVTDIAMFSRIITWLIECKKRLAPICRMAYKSY